MPKIVRTFAVAAALCMTGTTAFADGEGSYVFCDNGLRCVAAPCPSSSALNLVTGEVIKGISIDTNHLPTQDKATVDLPDKIYAGRLVLRGTIETRAVKMGAQTYSLLFLVASGIVRAANDSERNHCSLR